MKTMQAPGNAATTLSKGQLISKEYHEIQQAILAGKDRFTVNVGGVDKDIEVAAALGKHPDRFGRNGDTFHFNVIRVHEQDAKDGANGNNTTYKLGSLDGVDNVLDMKTVQDATHKEAALTISYPDGWIMSGGGDQ